MICDQISLFQISARLNLSPIIIAVVVVVVIVVVIVIVVILILIPAKKNQSKLTNRFLPVLNSLSYDHEVRLDKFPCW